MESNILNEYIQILKHMAAAPSMFAYTNEAYIAQIELLLYLINPSLKLSSKPGPSQLLRGEYAVMATPLTPEFADKAIDLAESLSGLSLRNS